MACNCGSSSFLHLSDCSSLEKQPENVYNAISSYLKQGKRVVYGLDYYRSYRHVIDVMKRLFKDDYLIASETASGGSLYIRNGGYLVVVRRDQADEVRGLTFDAGFVDQCDDYDRLAQAILPTLITTAGTIRRVDTDSHQIL